MTGKLSFGDGFLQFLRTLSYVHLSLRVSSFLSDPVSKLLCLYVSQIFPTATFPVARCELLSSDLAEQTLRECCLVCRFLYTVSAYADEPPPFGLAGLPKLCIGAKKKFELQPAYVQAGNHSSAGS